ncbi:MAG: trypsin-like peptidase domain-containing protein [Pseudomonadales bacterium]
MLSPATRIALSTLRLLCGDQGAYSSVGTGSLFVFRQAPDAPVIPVILTNKHVVGDFTRLQTTISTTSNRETLREDCSGEDIQHHVYEIIDLQQRVIRHPDPAIDLCAILCAPLIEHAIQRGHLRHMFLDESWLPDAETREIMRPVERVLMAGYPLGLWNERHNLPIVRDGLSASHPLVDWNGLRQFVIDVACFPGSSGSPVFLYEDGWYRTKQGNAPGTRAELIGFLWGGPTAPAEGRLEPRPIPTSMQVPVINTMMNLGYVVQADAVLDLKALMPFPSA